MEENTTPFGIKFGPGHFPVGTQFKVNLFHNRAYDEVTWVAKQVIRNGPLSYVVETETFDEVCGTNKAFHISHVTEIVKRGGGKLEMVNHSEFNESGDFFKDAKEASITMKIDVCLKTHYLTVHDNVSYTNLVARKVKKMAPIGTSVDMGRLMDALFNQTFVKRKTFVISKEFSWSRNYFITPKKRVDRWLKQNINRYLIKVKVAQDEYDDAMNAAYHHSVFEDWFD